MKLFAPLALLILLIGVWSCAKKEAQQPNVLFIITDDLNDMIEGLDGHHQVKTPHIKKLMEAGVTFTNAQCNTPICAPSRASMLSGLYPHTTGYYYTRTEDNDRPKWWDNPVLKDAQTIMQHFKANGYHVMGTGKIFHNHQEKYDQFHEYGYKASWGPWPWDGQSEKTGWGGADSYPGNYGSFSIDANYAPLSDVPDIPTNPETGTPGYKGWRLYGKPFRYNGPNDRDLMPDELNAQWTQNKLDSTYDKPFFLAVGINRPHVPLFAPKKFFDIYPLEKIELTKIKENDLADIFPEGKGIYNSNTTNWGFRKFELLTSKDSVQALKEWTQAYLANVSFVDAQIGKIMDKLNNCEFADNTLVIFTSDHGYHIGEKEWLFKNSVWEESTRIPFIVSGPGIRQGEKCHQPISLIDVYPTLVDYCGLPENPNMQTHQYALEGHSLRPLLENPSEASDDFNYALTTVGGVNKAASIETKRDSSHYSLRSKNFRYVLQGNGIEELYDHTKDPHEWNNLAGEATYEEQQKRMRNDLMKIIETTGSH